MPPDVLLNKLLDRPFRPFRARLSDNSTIDVLYHPGSVVVGPTNAIMPLKYVENDYGHKLVLRWKTVPLDHIVELVNLD